MSPTTADRLTGNLHNAPMGPRQLLIVAICAALNILDGFDILVLGFAAPSIMKSWSLGAAQMGLLFGVGPAGMMFGTLALAAFADAFGRRRAMLLCLWLGALGMLMGGWATNINQLLVSRLVTGLGVGGMMPTINTLVAEYASHRGRSTAIAVLAAGYPLGGTLGGLAVIAMGAQVEWRSLLLAGAMTSMAMILAASRWLPESIAYLLEHPSPRTLERINQILAQLRMPLLTRLPEYVDRQRGGTRAAPGHGLLESMTLFSAAMFLVQSSFYFLMSWAPTLLAGAGLPAAMSTSGAMLMNLGGLAGDLVFAALCRYRPARVLGAVSMVACFLGVIALASLPMKAALLLPAALLVGCFLFASMASLYAVAPTLLPTRVRAIGTGIALSIGRIGGAAGPFLGGALIATADRQPLQYLVILSAPLLIAALILQGLRPTSLAQTYET